MKGSYLRPRTFLRTIALGFVAVWMINGFDIARDEEPSQLPEATSGDVLFASPILEKQEHVPAVSFDLTGYDRGGEIEICNFKEEPELSQCLITRENARKFVYDHWQSKTKGYISVDFPCVDCGPTLHIFIQPDKKGHWQIATILVDDRYGSFPQPNAFSVKFRKAKAIERERYLTERVISFRDKTGKEIDSF